MEQLVASIPLLISILVPPLFALTRGWFGGIVPDRLVPVLLPIGGGVVAGIAHLVGVDATILANYSSDPNAWETVITGIMSGLAAVGVHQIKRQGDKAPAAGSAQRGFARPGALVLVLAAAGMALAGIAGCTGTRAAYKAAETPDEYAFVLTEHYAALRHEAANLAEKPTTPNSAMQALRRADLAAYAVVVGQDGAPGLPDLAAAYQRVRSAENEAALQEAINAAILRVADFVRAVKAARE